MGRKAPIRCSVRLHRRLLRPFSDSLSRQLGEEREEATVLDVKGKDRQETSMGCGV